MEVIVDLLKTKIGLNPGSIGESSIRRAVTHCMALHKIDTINVYSRLIQSSDTELKRLIEEIVVTETWFFRNQAQFQALANHVVSELLPQCSAFRPVRILSVPCSSGEEPYSVAITLREAGIPAELVHIDAIDISRRSVNTALAGCYSKNSFRDVDPSLIRNYFFQREDGYHLVSLIKKQVNFSTGNLLTDSLKEQFYDVVFCRNGLIYFDRDDQKTIINKLYHCLMDQGLMFVGHAESALVSSEQFSQLPDHNAFAFKKNGSCRAFLKSRGNQIRERDWAKIIDSISSSAQPLTKTPKPDKPKLRSLLPAERMVYQGRYIEAGGVCQEFLQHTPESAQAYYLLGLIKNFQGEDELAMKNLKKAIYLDPNHEAALSLALGISKKYGDHDAVMAYSRRVNRVRNRSSNSS
ncbi:MAG: hypothetical protein OEZ68_11195 [Gammaproteobacteria bacterium]|nr:hypothetical protein [Gammaproteobacteria bacterium]MDH5801358.1 hypothetical protein [Gammaproteobacteria bacterium]